MQKAGLELDDIDCVTNIFAAFNECSCKYASINWVKGSSVTALLTLAPPPQSNEWKTEKIHNRLAKCSFDISETSYTYCNNSTGIEAAKIELNPYVKNGNIYEKVLKDTEIDNLVTLIKKICPDALRDLPYETIERLFLQIAMLPEIDDDKEVALLKLMSAISRNEPTKCIENYKRFYALLEATYYNGSGSLLLHLYRQLDDRCLGFLAWQSNSKTSFIEGLIRMYNEQPTALGDRLNYFNDYIKTENYVDKVVVLGLTDTKMYQAFGSNTTYFNSYKILGEHNSLYNIRLYQVPVTTITTANPATVSTYTSTIVDESSKNYKYGYEYLSPLTPVMVDTKSAYASNALIQEAIQGQSQSIKPFLVPLLFFDYTKGAESLKQREDIIFEVLDIVTIASGIKMMTTARRYWALFETIGAVADIQVRVLDLPQNSSARKCVDIYNGIFGLIGIKNLATAAGGKTIKTVNQLVQAIKTVPNLEKDIVAGANISNSLRSKLISFRFAYAKAEADGLKELTLAQKEDLLRMEASTNELLDGYTSIFLANLKSYKKLLAAVDGLSDELKVKFVEDFIDAGDDVLKALDGDVIKIENWKNWDNFVSTQEPSYWAKFKTVPPIATVRRNACQALAKYPNEYVVAVEEMSEINKYDLFTRHGVDYGDEFWKIISDFKTKNAALGLSDADVHVIFGYTTNFFYGTLNSWLRDGINIQKTAKMKQLLNTALTKLPQWNGNIAYRGIGKNLSQQEIAKILTRYPKGTTVPHGEFTSTGSQVKASFVEKSQIELRINLKSNTKAKDISDLSDGVHYRGMPKHELILPPNTSLYVDDIFLDSTTGRTVISLFEQ